MKLPCKLELIIFIQDFWHLSWLQLKFQSKGGSQTKILLMIKLCEKCHHRIELWPSKVDTQMLNFIIFKEFKCNFVV